MEKIIYLDMDGVCCDFPSAAIRAHGGVPQDVFAAWERDHRGKSSGYEVMGLPDTAFWNATNHLDEAFWRNLAEYPWFRELYDGLRALAPVVFLSSAGACPAALAGKLRWLQDRFGPAFHDYVFTTAKEYVAQRGAVLVDDYEVYVAAFQRAGGQAVLFPQLWGRNAPITERVAYTLGEVQRCFDHPRALLRKVDCLRLYVPDLDAGLAFYGRLLGHRLIWRTERAAGLRLPEAEAEIVLQTESAGQEVDFTVDSADEAAARIQAAGGRVIVPPFDIRIGRCVVVQDPWGNPLVLLDTSKGLLATDEEGNVIGNISAEK